MKNKRKLFRAFMQGVTFGEMNYGTMLKQTEMYSGFTEWLQKEKEQKEAKKRIIRYNIAKQSVNW